MRRLSNGHVGSGSLFLALAALAMIAMPNSGDSGGLGVPPAISSAFDEEALAEGRQWALQETEGGFMLTLSDTSLFKPNRARLSPEGEIEAGRISDFLKRLNPAEVKVIAFANGSALDNPQFPTRRHLAAARATDVALAIEDAGVAQVKAEVEEGVEKIAILFCAGFFEDKRDLASEAGNEGALKDVEAQAD
jgi:outer membrane protein OmpA-like peptidoglycan-associated protein